MNAGDRLILSRERLRQAMHPARRPHDQNDTSTRANAQSDWLSRWRGSPAASLLLPVLEGWWARQPLRVALTLAAEAGTAVLEPTAQQHPIKLVMGAAAAGALFAAVRPWRWIPARTLLAGAIPQLLSEALTRRTAANKR